MLICVFAREELLFTVIVCFLLSSYPSVKWKIWAWI